MPLTVHSPRTADPAIEEVQRAVVQGLVLLMAAEITMLEAPQFHMPLAICRL